MLAHLQRETYFDVLQDSTSPSNHLLSYPSEYSHALKELNYSKKIGKWTPEEDELLHKYVPLFGEKQWRKISEYIPGRTSIQCLHRWTKILKPGLVKGPWTAEEDQKLIAWVKAEGPTKWAQAANFIKGRSGKQCRERWFNNLSPGVKKGNWAKEEDELIFELYQKYGSSWSKIAKFIPGRTENAIKNRFYSTLRKLAADKRRVKIETEEPESVHANSEDCDDDYYQDGTELSTSGQPTNILYKLLQEKTCSVEQPAPAPVVVKPSRLIKRIKPNDPLQDRLTNDRDKQAFNINGEKLFVVRDTKITEKAIQEAADRLAQAEIEDNDIAFEKFLLSLDSNIKDDFLTKEFDLTKESDDLGQFDKLQQKILLFCQNNIRDLNDAFKTAIPNNRIDKPPGKDNRIPEGRSRGSTVAIPLHTSTSGSIGSRREKSNVVGAGPQHHSTRGATIIPTIHDYQLSTRSNGPGATICPNIMKDFMDEHLDLDHHTHNYLDYHHEHDHDHDHDHDHENGETSQIMMSKEHSHHHENENESDNLSDLETYSEKVRESQNLLIQKSTDKQEKSKPQEDNMNNLLCTMNNTISTASNIHETYLNSLVEMAKKLPKDDAEENEKRMSFLFQQLYSLEGLLNNARSELKKLESCMLTTDENVPVPKAAKIEEGAKENISNSPSTQGSQTNKAKL